MKVFLFCPKTMSSESNTSTNIFHILRHCLIYNKWLTKKTEYSVFSQSLHGTKLGTQEVKLAFEPHINLLSRGLQGFTSSDKDFVLTDS